MPAKKSFFAKKRAESSTKSVQPSQPSIASQAIEAEAVIQQSSSHPPVESIADVPEMISNQEHKDATSNTINTSEIPAASTSSSSHQKSIEAIPVATELSKRKKKKVSFGSAKTKKDAFYVTVEKVYAGQNVSCKDKYLKVMDLIMEHEMKNAIRKDKELKKAKLLTEDNRREVIMQKVAKAFKEGIVNLANKAFEKKTIENERNTINQVRHTTYTKMLENLEREEQELKELLDLVNRDPIPSKILSEESKRIIMSDVSHESSQKLTDQIKQTIQEQEFQADNIIMVTGSIGNMQSHADEFCAKAKKAVKYHLEQKNQTIDPMEVVANLSQKL